MTCDDDDDDGDDDGGDGSGGDNMVDEGEKGDDCFPSPGEIIQLLLIFWNVI